MNKFKNTDNMSKLFGIAGNEYYFDLETLSQFVRLDKSESIEDILGEVKKEIESEKANKAKKQLVKRIIPREFVKDKFLRFIVIQK